MSFLHPSGGAWPSLTMRKESRQPIIKPKDGTDTLRCHSKRVVSGQSSMRNLENVTSVLKLQLSSIWRVSGATENALCLPFCKLFSKMLLTLSIVEPAGSYMDNLRSKQQAIGGGSAVGREKGGPSIRLILAPRVGSA